MQTGTGNFPLGEKKNVKIYLFMIAYTYVHTNLPLEHFTIVITDRLKFSKRK